MKATAVAHANIALVKYWGKRDEKLILPQNNSISMTTDCLSVKTTVEFSLKYKEDIFILDGRRFKRGSPEYDKYFLVFLDKVRKLAKTNFRVKVSSQTNFPRAAGLASSSAGFAAFAAAANEALDLRLNDRELSVLARQGSGSASRSIFGGFAEWQKGERKDGSDSFAKQIADENHWSDFGMVICLTSKEEKKIKSRAGMAQSVKTSPFYSGWLKTIDADLKKVRRGIIERDFSLVGKIAEENCLKMHALMLTTKPAIIYWNAKTIELIHKIIEWRENGLECYFTIDAGPQVKILCLKANLSEILKRVRRMAGIEGVITAKPGPGPKIVNANLF